MEASTGTAIAEDVNKLADTLGTRMDETGSEDNVAKKGDIEVVVFIKSLSKRTHFCFDMLIHVQSYFPKESTHARCHVDSSPVLFGLHFCLC